MAAVAILTLVFLITVANLVLGYAAVAYLGIGPKTREQFQAALAPRKVMLIPAAEPLAEEAAPAPIQPAPTKPVAVAENDTIERRCGELFNQINRFHAQLLMLGQECDALDRRDTEAIDSWNERLGVEAYEHLEALNRQMDPLMRLQGEAEVDQWREASQTSIDEALKKVNVALTVESSETGAKPEPAQTLSMIRTIAWFLRDELENNLAEMLLADQPPGKAPPELLIDAQTGQATRLGFEEARRKGLASDSTKPLAAMIDVDHCHDLIHNHGLNVAEAIIESIAEKLPELVSHADTVARSCGQRFLLLFTQDGIDDVAQQLEKMRQTLAKTQFLLGEDKLTVSVSIAITAISAKESSQAMHERLANTMKEAKEYGRNRTFVCEADTPTPVNPPVFEIEERAIYLQG